jgi:hypothetical protein
VFLQQPLTRRTRQAVCTIKQSIFNMISMITTHPPIQHGSQLMLKLIQLYLRDIVNHRYLRTNKADRPSRQVGQVRQTNKAGRQAGPIDMCACFNCYYFCFKSLTEPTSQNKSGWSGKYSVYLNKVSMLRPYF